MANKKVPVVIAVLGITLIVTALLVTNLHSPTGLATGEAMRAVHHELGDVHAFLAT